jgi:Ribbon-helix-helix protein, copG family
MNKCTEVVRLHLDEELKGTIEALAVREGRAVSEWIRERLRLLVYGLAHERSLEPQSKGSEGR